jgi:hypothetical protein
MKKTLTYYSWFFWLSRGPEGRVHVASRQEAVGALRLLLRTALRSNAVRNKLRADTSRRFAPMIFRCFSIPRNLRVFLELVIFLKKYSDLFFLGNSLVSWASKISKKQNFFDFLKFFGFFVSTR